MSSEFLIFFFGDRPHREEVVDVGCCTLLDEVGGEVLFDRPFVDCAFELFAAVLGADEVCEEALVVKPCRLGDVSDTLGIYWAHFFAVDRECVLFSFSRSRGRSEPFEGPIIPHDFVGGDIGRCTDIALDATWVLQARAIRRRAGAGA